jgi:hypothetical protein
MKVETTDSLRAGAVGELATFRNSAPTYWRRNGDTPIGYLRQAVLMREQCDMMTE